MVSKFPLVFPGPQVQKRMFPCRKPTSYITLPCATALACVGLCDSDAELTVLAKGVLPHEDLQRVGQVKLRGRFGDSVDADLVLVKMRLADSLQGSDYLNIHCAVCEGVNDSLILTADVVRKLTQLRNAEHICLQANCFEFQTSSTPTLTVQSANINGISNT